MRLAVDEEAAFERLRQFRQLADTLADAATREQLVETALCLSLALTHYQRTFGDLPLEGSWDFRGTEMMSGEQADHVAGALENFAGMLGNLIGPLADDVHSPMQ